MQSYLSLCYRRTTAMRNLPQIDQESTFFHGRGGRVDTLPPTDKVAEGAISKVNERPLSNKLISIRDNRKLGTKDTTGSIEIYPSMAVLKRDYSKFEQDYYDMVARFGKKSRVGESRRGQIDHFSKSARYRMLKKLGSIGREDPPFMVTLTYRSGSVTFNQAKKDLQKFRKRLDREFGIKHYTAEEYTTKDGFVKIRKRIKYEGTWSGVWRFEITTGRGTRAKSATPHFHILVWCEDWHDMQMQDLDYRISKMWCDVTGDGGDDRMKYGCDIKSSSGDQTKIKNYMLGHQSKKSDQEVIGGGRHWGIMNEELLKIGQPTATYEMTSSQRNKYSRMVRKLISQRSAKKERDISDLKQTHLVISPHDIRRILLHLGVSEAIKESSRQVQNLSSLDTRLIGASHTADSVA